MEVITDPQVDELRALGVALELNATKIVASIVFRAADTIEKLRQDLRACETTEARAEKEETQ